MGTVDDGGPGPEYGSAPAAIAVGDGAGLLPADEGSQGDVGGERGDLLHVLGAAAFDLVVDHRVDRSADRLGRDRADVRLDLEARNKQGLIVFITSSRC